MEVAERHVFQGIPHTQPPFGGLNRFVIYGTPGTGKSCIYFRGAHLLSDVERDSPLVVQVVETPTSGVVHAIPLWSEIVRGRTGTCNAVTLHAHEREPSDAAPTVADQLSFIRGTLSLNVSELATVLHVERPTIYAWLEDRSSPQPANRERVSQLYLVARAWRLLSDLPVGDAIRHKTTNGVSVVELLQIQDLPFEEIRQRLRRLATYVRSREERKGGIGDRVRAAAAARGLEPTLAGLDDDEVGLVTGRRGRSE